MSSIRFRGSLGAAALALVATPTLAHVSFETAQVPANTTQRAVLRVPHGCDGKATNIVRVQIPEGVTDVKPMPKAGWTLATTQGADKSVREIVWSGGDLPDAFYDEFVFRARFPAALAGQALTFPVVQECGSASERWVEIARDGQTAHDLKFPAPVIKVAAPASAARAPAVRAEGLLIEQPWSRATPGGAKVAGGYVRITNTGSAPDRLVGGTFSASGRVEIHEMSVSDGVMRMRPLPEGLPVEPGATLELKPGGYHAMFLDLQRPLKEGETVSGSLLFEKAGSVPLTYTVRGIGAQNAGEDHSQH
jgi:uncharacterized protein YcnI